MRVECLNIWGGKLKGPLIDHLQAEAKATDIFCLQEVFRGTPAHEGEGEVVLNIYDQIRAALPDHTCHYMPAHGPEGLAMFVRHDVQTIDGGNTTIHKWDTKPDSAVDQDRVLHFVNVELAGRKITIANIHGLQLGADKGDTPERLVQFQTAKTVLVHGPTVLCGDFNVRPNTKSLGIFENDPDPERRLVNLVTWGCVKTTRTPLYPWRETEPYADYILVSERPLIRDVSFRVLTDVVVSDHYPLVVDFT